MWIWILVLMSIVGACGAILVWSWRRATLAVKKRTVTLACYCGINPTYIEKIPESAFVNITRRNLYLRNWFIWKRQLLFLRELGQTNVIDHDHMERAIAVLNFREPKAIADDDGTIVGYDFRVGTGIGKLEEAAAMPYSAGQRKIIAAWNNLSDEQVVFVAMLRNYAVLCDDPWSLDSVRQDIP